MTHRQPVLCLRVREPSGWPVGIPRRIDVYPGLTGINGPAGTGKTRVLAALAGLASAQSAELEWRGLPVVPGRWPEFAQIRAYVPALPWSALHLRVEEVLTIAAGLWKRPVGADRIGAALDDWDLRAVAGRQMARISAGEVQKTLLAASLLSQPSIWLVDSPFRHLDLAGRVSLQDALARRFERGWPEVIVWTDVDPVLMPSDTRWINL